MPASSPAGMSPLGSDTTNTSFCLRITLSWSTVSILLGPGRPHLRPGAPSQPSADNGIVARPIVALVGRPNTGKSTLFNRMIGWRKAIVDREPGLTRDRLYGVAEWRGRVLTVVGTAGFHLVPKDDEPPAHSAAQ